MELQASGPWGCGMSLEGLGCVMETRANPQDALAVQALIITYTMSVQGKFNVDMRWI